MTTDKPDAPIDWSLTTWKGVRRETLRRWAELPLEQVIAAQEEMAEFGAMLVGENAAVPAEARDTVHEPPTDYEVKNEPSPD